VATGGRDFIRISTEATDDRGHVASHPVITNGVGKPTLSVGAVATILASLAGPGRSGRAARFRCVTMMVQVRLGELRGWYVAMRTPCAGCDDPHMVEYGQGVGQATGAAGGSHGGGTVDAGAAFGQFVSDTVNNITALPPTTLFLAFVAIVVAFIILKRAF
jgi:hypothetical protein